MAYCYGCRLKAAETSLILQLRQVNFHSHLETVLSYLLVSNCFSLFVNLLVLAQSVVKNELDQCIVGHF